VQAVSSIEKRPSQRIIDDQGIDVTAGNCGPGDGCFGDTGGDTDGTVTGCQATEFDAHGALVERLVADAAVSTDEARDNVTDGSSAT
jgi:hypothetical protein